MTLSSHLKGEKPEDKYLDFPTVSDGVRGIAFLDTVISSSETNEKWTAFKS